MCVVVRRRIDIPSGVYHLRSGSGGRRERGRCDSESANSNYKLLHTAVTFVKSFKRLHYCLLFPSNLAVKTRLGRNVDLCNDPSSSRLRKMEDNNPRAVQCCQILLMHVDIPV